MLLTKCPVCNADNLDFSVRCSSCGSLLQQHVKSLDLFSTIYSLWRYPSFTLRKILLAEHRNFTILFAVLEAIGLSFLSLFIVKAADVYSVELWRLLVVGTGFAFVIFLPVIYLFSILSYFATKSRRTGVSLRGFISATIYGLHPLAISSIVVLPTEVAVFGPFVFSNNPSPQVINALPFYFLGILYLVCVAASIFFVTRLTQILFGSRIKVAISAGVFLGIFLVGSEIAKRILLK